MTDRKIIVVTGCRDWAERDIVDGFLLVNLCGYNELAVFHGDCPTGADRFVQQWIEDHEEEVTSFEFEADWGKHGRAAGPIRNGQMLRTAKSLQGEDDSGGTELECVAFWDGKSRGTLNCISQATALGIPVRIVPRRK